MKFPLPLLLALLATAITSKGQATYEMTFIGSFAGTSISGVISTPTGINSSGDVVGWAYTGSGVRQGFVYSNGSVTNVGNSSNPSSPHTYASVNDSGTLAGSSSIDAIFRSGTTVTSLATLGGTNGGSATGINNAGQIVGYSWTSGNAAQHAFLYSGGSMTDLGSLGTGANGSYAWAINNSGTVVGESYVTGSRTHAFSYSGGILTDLTPGYSSSTGAYSVNDLGLAVGFAYTGSGITAVRFGSSTFTSLGSLGGSVGTAYDVNSVGDIVGWSRTTGGADHAFLYSSGSMLDLNSITNLPSRWVLTNAIAINDAGAIAASATYGGVSYAVVLTAIPEPSTYAAMVGAFALLGTLTIRRIRHQSAS